MFKKNRILLNHGADLNLPIALTDSEISNLKPMEEVRCAGSGALIEASKCFHLELVRELLRRGALDYDNRALSIVVLVCAYSVNLYYLFLES